MTQFDVSSMVTKITWAGNKCWHACFYYVKVRRMVTFLT